MCFSCLFYSVSLHKSDHNGLTTEIIKHTIWMEFKTQEQKHVLFMFIEPIYRSVLMAGILTVLTLF